MCCKNVKNASWGFASHTNLFHWVRKSLRHKFRVFLKFFEKYFEAECTFGVGANLTWEKLGKLFQSTTYIFFKMGRPRLLLSFIFDLCKQTSLQIFNKLMWKNVHTVYGAGIQTQDLRNMIPYFAYLLTVCQKLKAEV